MAVQNENYRADYVGSGVATLVVPFYFLEDSHLLVTKKVIATAIETTLVLVTDYTVTGAGLEAGGSITLTVAPTAAETITILRDVPEEQQTEYVEGDPFPAATHERALDYLTMLVQQVSERVGRCFKLSVTDTTTDPTLPPAQEGYVLGWVGGLLTNLGAATAQLAADLLSTATGKGASLVSYIASFGAAIPRTVQLKLDDFACFNDIEPNADGITNDAVKLNTYQNANAGKNLLLKAGTYLVEGNSMAIEAPSRWLGEPATVLKLATSTTSKSMLDVNSGTDGTVIEGITFDLNQLAAESHTNIGVRVFGGDSVTFRDCLFTNSAASGFPAANRGYGIYLNGAFEIVKILNCTFEGIMYAVVTEPSSTGQRVLVDGCDFVNLSGDGVEINVPTGSCERVTVTNCRFTNLGSTIAGRGFGVGASGGTGGTIKSLIIDNNQFTSVDNQAIHIEDGCRDVKITKNSIYGCGFSTATSFGAGIYVARGVVGARTINDVIIDGNHITNTTNTDYGIFCSGSYVINNLKIKNNTVDCAGAGLGITANSVVQYLDCDANFVKNANGVGIRCDAVSGFLTNNVCFDDQTVKTQTYGIELQPSGRTLTIRGNKMTGNVNNGFLLSTLTFPKTLLSDELRLTDIAAGAGAYSDWVDTIYLGVGANGQVTTDYMSGTDRSAGLHTVNWDGTSLTGTKINIDSSGNLAISATFSAAFQMNGNWLQTRVFNAGGALTNITEMTMFEGMILLK